MKCGITVASAAFCVFSLSVPCASGEPGQSEGCLGGGCASRQRSQLQLKTIDSGAQVVLEEDKGKSATQGAKPKTTLRTPPTEPPLPWDHGTNAVAIEVHFGRSTQRHKKCVHQPNTRCEKDAGDPSNLVPDFEKGATFEITGDDDMICAKRTDKPQGWWMDLRLWCFATDKTRVTIGKSRLNKKCVYHPNTRCQQAAKHFPSWGLPPFEITGEDGMVCAKRTDRENEGWDFSLQLKCAVSPEAGAVLLKRGHRCKGSSLIRYADTLSECTKQVASFSQRRRSMKERYCGTQFTFDPKRRHCACYPATEGGCVFTKDEKHNVFSLFPYIYIKWNDALCLNRGGVGGGTDLSVNKADVQQCAAAVAKNKRCGNEFSFGQHDGWCDCVPKEDGPCTWYTDDNTKLQAYSVYTLR